MPSVTGSGFSPALVATRTLTDAQIKGIPTTPVAIIPAPGASSSAILIHATLRLSWAADYTGIDVGSTLALGNGATLAAILDETTPSASVSGLLASGESAWALMTALAFAPASASAARLEGSSGNLDSDVVNRAIMLSSSNALAFTGGNAANALKVTVVYYVTTF